MFCLFWPDINHWLNMKYYVKIFQFIMVPATQCTNVKSNCGWSSTSPTLMQCNSVRGQVHLGFALVYLPPTLLTLPWSYTQCPIPDSGNVNSVGGQVHLGCASVYLPLTLSTLHRSCTRCTPQILLQSWLGGRTSTPWLHLGVLASLLVNFALK